MRENPRDKHFPRSPLLWPHTKKHGSSERHSCYFARCHSRPKTNSPLFISYF